MRGLPVSESSLSSMPLARDAGGMLVPPPVGPWKLPHTGKVGIITFLCSEVCFFSTLIVAYVVFYGRDSLTGGMGGPTPRDVLSLPLVLCTTLCLLYSSVTIHLADRALRRRRPTTFIGMWTGTIALGTVFLLGTAWEWNELINHHQLTISRNLFGTTFYTLVGFHALHVTVGVIVMTIVLYLALRRHLAENDRGSIELISWYWHFVDAVWIVVFTVVYLMPHFE